MRRVFDEDREVKHAVAIGLKESLDLIGAIRLLTEVRQLLIEGLAKPRFIMASVLPILDLSLIVLL